MGALRSDVGDFEPHLARQGSLNGKIVLNVAGCGQFGVLAGITWRSAKARHTGIQGLIYIRRREACGDLDFWSDSIACESGLIVKGQIIGKLEGTGSLDFMA